MMYGNMVNFDHFMSSIFQYVLMYVLITAKFVVIFYFLAKNVFSNICTLTLALPTGASQAREGTFPTIETLLRPGFVREAMRSLQIALFIIYLANLTQSEKITLSEDF